MDSARSDALPRAVQVIAAITREVLVCCPVDPPNGWVDHLRALVPPAVRLEFQCSPATGTRVILALLNHGHQVFEGEVPPHAQIIFDRRHGFRLPEWTPIPDAFGAACQLTWSRTAAFGRLHGTVMAVEDDPANDFALVRLAENPHLRLSVPKSLGALSADRAVTLLCRHDFRFGMDLPLLECVAIFDDD